MVRPVRRLAAAAVFVAAVVAVVGGVGGSGSPAQAIQPGSAAVHSIRPTSAGQLVVVSAPEWGTADAQLTGFRWNGVRWVAELGPLPVTIGRNGFTADPHEADGYTPIGQYDITTLFGRNPNPGTAMAYSQTTSDDHWVDDPASSVYNTWQTGPAAGRWTSAEDLSGYAYAIAFDFNQGPVVPDGNSAIFIHGGSVATPGCIEMPGGLLDLMRWLDPTAHPQVVLGVEQGPPVHLPTTAATVTSPATTGVTTAATVPAPTSTSCTVGPPDQPVVGVIRTSSGGLWLTGSDGEVQAVGAPCYGSLAGLSLTKPIVGMASAPDGRGYWLVASDGGVFSFGSASFFGSTGAIVLNKPIVGMASAPDGRGYWLVASDGGVFSFGSASFFGSTGAIVLNKPIVGMASAPDGRGYWLVASDGGVFSFGSASFFGSTGAIVLNKPIVGMASAPDGRGYWLVASDGGVFSFGSAGFAGSAVREAAATSVTTVARPADGHGYLMAGPDGSVYGPYPV